MAVSERWNVSARSPRVSTVSSGILHKVDGVAGVQVGPDEILTGGLDHPAHFVTGDILVVLERDLQAGIHSLGAYRAQDPGHGFDVLIDRSGRQAGAVAREQGAEDGRAHAVRAADGVAEQFNGCVEAVRGLGQRGTGIRFDPQSKPRRLVLHHLPVGRIVGGRVGRIQQIHAVQLEPGGVLQHLHVGPAETAQAVGIQTQGYAIQLGASAPDRITPLTLREAVHEQFRQVGDEERTGVVG